METSQRGDPSPLVSVRTPLHQDEGVEGCRVTDPQDTGRDEQAECRASSDDQKRVAAFCTEPAPKVGWVAQEPQGSGPHAPVPQAGDISEIAARYLPASSQLDGRESRDR